MDQLGNSRVRWIARLETEGDKEEGANIPADAARGSKCHQLGNQSTRRSSMSCNGCGVSGSIGRRARQISQLQ